MRLFVAFLFLNNAVPGASAAVSSKVYAIYFPQFHEDKLNNLLWEKGFTGVYICCLHFYSNIMHS